MGGYLPGLTPGLVSRSSSARFATRSWQIPAHSTDIGRFTPETNLTSAHSATGGSSKGTDFHLHYTHITNFTGYLRKFAIYLSLILNSRNTLITLEIARPLIGPFYADSASFGSWIWGDFTHFIFSFPKLFRNDEICKKKKKVKTKLNWNTHKKVTLLSL